MTVQAIWTPGGEFDLTGSGYDPVGTVLAADGATASIDRHDALRWCLLTGAICNEASLRESDGRWTMLGDPTEAAMLVAAGKARIDPAGFVETHPRTANIPFNSERQFMATLHRQRDSGEYVALVKGAVERVVAMCDGMLTADGSIQPIDRDGVLRAAEELAGRGLRVLATATGKVSDPDDFEEQCLSGTLVLNGLQAMWDPPRTAATTAISACRGAGISVKMITGDHAATASVIARHVGLLDSNNGDERAVLTGAELASLSPEEFPEAVTQAVVFARVSPEQKLRLVEALQSRGEVVAMTGDGVNDAPALRRANIGVAMGHSGTEVAKDAADVVLTEDDFSTIEAAVEEGGGVFDNLTKFITWTLPTNLSEGLVILVAIFFGTTLPILPTQILWT